MEGGALRGLPTDEPRARRTQARGDRRSIDCNSAFHPLAGISDVLA